MLCTISVVVSSLCFGLLWNAYNTALFCLFIVQYLFVACSCLYGNVYMMVVGATTARAKTELRTYNLWIVGCFVIMSIQTIILSIAQL